MLMLHFHILYVKLAQKRIKAESKMPDTDDSAFNCPYLSIIVAATTTITIQEI